MNLSETFCAFRRGILQVPSLTLLLITTASAQEQEIPKITGGEIGPTLLQLAGALLLIVALIYLSVWLMKKYSHGKISGGGNLISIVERRHLTPKQAIYLIKVGEQHLLVGASESGLTKLTDIEIETAPSSAAPAGSRTPSGRFSQILKQARESLMSLVPIKNRSIEA